MRRRVRATEFEFMRAAAAGAIVLYSVPWRTVAFFHEERINPRTVGGIDDGFDSAALVALHALHRQAAAVVSRTDDDIVIRKIAAHANLHHDVGLQRTGADRRSALDRAGHDVAGGVERTAHDTRGEHRGDPIERAAQLIEACNLHCDYVGHLFGDAETLFHAALNSSSASGSGVSSSSSGVPPPFMKSSAVKGSGRFSRSR